MMQSKNTDIPSNLTFNSPNILPLSKNRIRALRRIINGRKVAILVGGSSLNEFQERIEEFRKHDVCFFGINRFIQEEYILSEINKSYSIFMCSTRENMPNYFDSILNFLDRDEDNMFISSLYRDTFGALPDTFDYDNFNNIYDRKLLFYWLSDQGSYPNKKNPLVINSTNSLMSSMQLAIIGKASAVILFGADGFSSKYSNEKYFKHKLYAGEGDYRQNFEDTRYFFNRIFFRTISNVYRTYGLKKIDIINCSVNSNYLWMPKFHYDEVLSYLNGTYNVSFFKKITVFLHSMGENLLVMTIYHVKRIKNIPGKIRKILYAHR